MTAKRQRCSTCRRSATCASCVRCDDCGHHPSCGRKRKTWEDITSHQWRQYRRVQDSARYNMLDPQARRACSMTEEDFALIQDNYGKLAEKFDGETGSDV